VPIACGKEDVIGVQAKQSRPKQVTARLYASTAPGPGQRPGSKVRTAFEDAHGFRKVRILENPGDFFEDAHPFPRCAQKSAHLRGQESLRSSARLIPAILPGGGGSKAKHHRPSTSLPEATKKSLPEARKHA
jgi:hypothetical protein